MNKLEKNDPNYRVYNFGAGPAAVPEDVLRIAQAELLNYAGTGMSIMELSHRGKHVVAMFEETLTLFKELMSIPDNYKIILAPGGATQQFDAIPLNLFKNGKADYLVTGVWSEKAAKAAEKYITVNEVGNSKDRGFTYIPPFNVSGDDIDYYHYTANNTIYGTAINNLPNTKAPIVADMTSSILSRDYDVSKFGVIYAGVQKQIGIGGLGVVIVRDDLLGNAKPETSIMHNWQNYVKADNMHNTPPVFAVYITNLFLHWIKSNGGIAALEAKNIKNAEILYDVLDTSSMYKPYVEKDARSIMNVTFSCGSPELDAKFVKESEEIGLAALKGYRTLGGIRASIYNAMSLEGVEALAKFMKEFEAKNA